MPTFGCARVEAGIEQASVPRTVFPCTVNWAGWESSLPASVAAGPEFPSSQPTRRSASAGIPKKKSFICVLPSWDVISHIPNEVSSFLFFFYNATEKVPVLR